MDATELVNHLVHMERRWFVWGFLGEHIDDPWGDRDADGTWHTDAGVEELLTSSCRRESHHRDPP